MAGWLRNAVCQNRCLAYGGAAWRVGFCTEAPSSRLRQISMRVVQNGNPFRLTCRKAAPLPGANLTESASGMVAGAGCAQTCREGDTDAGTGHHDNRGTDRRSGGLDRGCRTLHARTSRQRIAGHRPAWRSSALSRSATSLRRTEIGTAIEHAQWVELWLTVANWRRSMCTAVVGGRAT